LQDSGTGGVCCINISAGRIDGNREKLSTCGNRSWRPDELEEPDGELAGLGVLEGGAAAPLRQALRERAANGTIPTINLLRLIFIL